MMKSTLIVLAAIALIASSASATTVTWGMAETANDDGMTSRYGIYVQADDRAVLGFRGTFYCSAPLVQALGDLGEDAMMDPDPPYEMVQIDTNADALLAHTHPDNPGVYDMNMDTWVSATFDFIPDPFAEGVNTYSGFAGTSPAWDPTQGLGSWVMAVQLVAPSGLTFDEAIGAGDFGFGSEVLLWEEGTDAVWTEAPFGIPEPMTMTLLAISGLALIRRRRA